MSIMDEGNLSLYYKKSEDGHTSAANIFKEVYLKKFLKRDFFLPPLVSGVFKMKNGLFTLVSVDTCKTENDTKTHFFYDIMRKREDEMLYTVFGWHETFDVTNKGTFPLKLRELVKSLNFINLIRLNSVNKFSLTNHVVCSADDVIDYQQTPFGSQNSKKVKKSSLIAYSNVHAPTNQRPPEDVRIFNPALGNGS